jgi:CubicO group peptidase (beta-lactamase class C family)
VILVAKNGKPIYQRAAGMASRAWNAPNRMDTKFNTASIGKMFTAVAIAQLVEQGKLSYEDTLEKTLSDYPNQEIARKVTVRHLLTHTSGLTEARTPLSGDNSFRQGFRTIKEYMSGSASDTLKFDPGHKAGVQQLRLSRPRRHYRKGIRSGLLHLYPRTHLQTGRHDRIGLL